MFQLPKATKTLAKMGFEPSLALMLTTQTRPYSKGQISSELDVRFSQKRTLEDLKNRQKEGPLSAKSGRRESVTIPAVVGIGFRFFGDLASNI